MLLVAVCRALQRRTVNSPQPSFAHFSISGKALLASVCLSALQCYGIQLGEGFRMEWSLLLMVGMVPVVLRFRP